MPGPGGGPGLIKEGAEATDAIASEQRRTMSRRELQQRHPAFAQLSPETGQLDLDATDAMFGADPDEALAVLADASGATDQGLRRLARAAAARLALDLVGTTGRSGGARARLRTRRLTDGGGDIDIEASLDVLVDARASGRPVDPEQLQGPGWERPGLALCLLVDRSGSMGGERLATAAVAASAVALRSAADFSVVAFAEDAVVVKAQHDRRPVSEVVDVLLALRGHGPTDLALGLRAARLQLARSAAVRRVVIVLSDCRSTAGADPVAEAELASELAVMAPDDDASDARLLAAAVGAAMTTVAGPSAVAEAFAVLFER